MEQHVTSAKCTRYTTGMNTEEIKLHQQSRKFCWWANLYNTKCQKLTQTTVI